MGVTGAGKKRVLILAEAPGKEEDKHGKQLIGEAGQYLREVLESMEYKLDRDFWKINAVNCRPPKNREPSINEIDACWPMVHSVIKENQPKAILTLGKVALSSILRYVKPRENVESVSKWVGFRIPNREWKAYICPTYHPSYLMRHSGSPSKEKALLFQFKQHVQNAMSADSMADWTTLSSEDNPTKILFAADEINKILKWASTLESPVAFDYETTGLKPDAKGQEVVSISISAGADSTYAFPYSPEIRKAWVRFLISNTPKVAQNMKFEETWSRVFFGVSVNSWHWDTMLASHCLDNRTGITGLKFQSFVRWGVEDYDSEVSPFLKAPGSNKLNTIHQAPISKLLMYNGMDSFLELLLFIEQTKEFKKNKIKRGFDLLMKGAIALVDAERNGIVFDEAYAEKQSKKLRMQIDNCKQKIAVSDISCLWKNRFGDKTNWLSSDQLGKVLFEDKDYTPTRFTTTGKPGTGIDDLKEVDHPAAKMFVRAKHLQKMRSTYLRGFNDECVDGVIHPFFNLHIARTFRSSSDSPNFQNIPVRDAEASKLIRSAIKAKPGCRIVEADYGALEVCIAACYHKDPAMIKYITDPSKDMHRDMAAECFMVTQKEVTKKLRYAGKNSFVFPQFYGSYFKQCAPDLWKYKDEKTVSGRIVMDVLAENGISRLGSCIHGQTAIPGTYEFHLQRVERTFWKDRFPVYDEWRRNWFDKYLNKGFLRTLTGFRCSGFMARNDVINYPVQGAAFHCLLWSFIRLGQEMRERGYKSTLIGQIHDSILANVYEEEFEDYKKLVHFVMVEELMAEWDWIIVPLTIEIEATPVGGSWYEKKTVE